MAIKQALIHLTNLCSMSCAHCYLALGGKVEHMWCDDL